MNFSDFWTNQVLPRSVNCNALIYTPFSGVPTGNRWKEFMFSAIVPCCLLKFPKLSAVRERFPMEKIPMIFIPYSFLEDLPAVNRL